MPVSNSTNSIIIQQQQLIYELRAQLNEANATLDAISNGEVDALVVGKDTNTQIFTLENADRPYRFLIEQMREGAMTLSDDGVILYANPRIANVLGAEIEKIVGTNLKSYFHKSDLSRLESIFSPHSTLCRGEFEIHRADRTTIPIYFSANEVVSDTSSLRLMGALITDLSEQRQMEERLRQTQKMEAVGQLTGGLAHDFNNLLQAICGNLNLIKLKPDDPSRVSKWAENGLQAAMRGAKLTSQLLAFSRLQQIDLKPISPNLIIDGMKNLLKHTFGTAVDIRYDQHDEAVMVFGDQTQLELAILNLAINARDAMPHGGKLTIRTKLRFFENEIDISPGNYMEISVTDTGIGMPVDVVERAFEPFFTTKGTGQGTGLGLAQVYGIAQQAGGTVKIESVVGEGTTVSILLKQAPQNNNLVQPDNESDDISKSKTKTTVLVIDDDDDVRNSIVETLIVLGYDVSDAADGLSGMQLMLEKVPDLLIIDYAMPVHNGAEIVKMARARGFEMPVIFASGYSDKSALNEAAGAEANLLFKPFTIASLSQALEKAIRV